MITVWDVPVVASVEEIVRLLQAEIRSQGIDLLKNIKPSGTNLMVTCPNHGEGTERKPSCGITLVDVQRGNQTFTAGTVHCFTCEYTADLPAFVSTCLGYNDAGYKGFKWLMAKFVVAEAGTRKLDIHLSRELPSTTTSEYHTEEELAKYRYTHPYMYTRGLTDKVISYFDIGYDPKTNSVTFPVKDLNGNVPMIQRRLVEGKGFYNPEDEKKPLYGLYEVYRNLDKLKDVWITESCTDALTCWVNGKAGVATMGTPTSNQLELLNKVPLRRMILAFDNDKAGWKFRDRVVKQLTGKLLYEVIYPEGKKDLNEFSLDEFKKIRINMIY